MKNLLPKFVTAILLLSFTVASNLNAQSIDLSQVSESLSSYEGTEYDFVEDADISYKEIGEDKYDNVFEESAIIYATVVQVKKTLEGVNDESLKPTGGYVIDLIGFAKDDLPKMKDRAEKLSEKAKQLKPKDDFTGFGAAKAPKAASGLKTSTEYLNTSLEELPGLTEEVMSLAKELLNSERN